MPPHPRYQIFDVIGTGDFASVHRGRDMDLGRDVAIKQIHPHLLNDPQKLELFWREAQLLASLEHPHVITIYDIVRSHGWLVLELMQGTLHDSARGRPLDLDVLRGALSGGLQALAMLHHHRVLHGDIKPSNLLLDRMGRVKIGDFGLARRVTNEQGSFLKGATRYIAPEVVAPQIGPVGPYSDLYSLGFTMYELLCGAKQFETLFPGLEAFGRDKQMAWMLWHAAPDRRLPEISRVLEGVPPDLAKVIQRLTNKSLAQRYRTAEEALADLDSRAHVPTMSSGAEEERAARKKKRKRRLAFGALFVSAALCAGIAFWPEPTKPTPPPPKVEEYRGEITKKAFDINMVVLALVGEEKPKEITFHEGDTVFINDKVNVFSNLELKDQVLIVRKQNEKKQPYLEIKAFRPQTSEASVTKVRTADGEIEVKLASGEALKLTVPPDIPIEINGEAKRGAKPFELKDLKAGDRISLNHFQDERGPFAQKISAWRMVEGRGIVRQVDAAKKKVSIAASEADGAPVTVWQLTDKCVITLNGQAVLDKRTLTPADLKPGDVVTFEHESNIARIAAQRQFQQQGTATAIRYDAKSFNLATKSGDKMFVLAPNCKISLGGETVPFDDLRRGDAIEVVYESPDAQSPAVSDVKAQRPASAQNWAIVLACGNYDDLTLAGEAAVTDAKALAEIMTKRYAIPADQVLLLTDPSRVRLEQGFTEAIEKSKQAKQLLVLVDCRSALGEGNAPLLAPKDFAGGRPDGTGVKLTWLVGELEKSTAQQKILLLDARPANKNEASVGLSSSADLIRSVLGTKNSPLLRSVTVLAANDTAARKRLSQTLTQALAGSADKNQDLLCELSELQEYLQEQARAGSPGVDLLVPNTTPPRITPDAAAAIQKLATAVSQTKPDWTEAKSLYESAQSLSSKEPEARLLASMLLIKMRKHDDAQKLLDEVTSQKPKNLLGWETSAWTRFEKLNYGGTISDLNKLVAAIPDKNAEQTISQLLPWVGRIREFSASVPAQAVRPTATALEALDSAVAKRGAAAVAAYNAGREAVRKVVTDFDQQLAATEDADAQLKIKVNRIQPRNYVAFPYDVVVQQIVAGLEE